MTWTRSLAAGLFGLLLAARADAGGDDAVPDVVPPKSWDHFVILPWQFKTDAPRDRALYESVNLRGFHIDRKNNGLQAFARETNWPYYVDHAAGKGYLHLGAAGDALSRKSGILVRPNSLAPAFIKAFGDGVTGMVTYAVSG